MMRFTRGMMVAGLVAAFFPASSSAFNNEVRKEVQIAKVCCPTIVGNCYGYHQTRWRVMGPCLDDTGRPCGTTATLPPVVLPPMTEPAPKPAAPKPPAPMTIPKTVDPLPKTVDPVPKSKVKAEPEKVESIPAKMILPPDVADVVMPVSSGYGTRTEPVKSTPKKVGGFAESR